MLKNAVGKNFSWSPSAISDYINCPTQYGAKRFYCTLPFVQTIQMKHGEVEHKHLEDRLLKKTPLPAGYIRGEKYCRILESSGGTLFAEQELAIDENMKFVKWFDKTAYGRCKIDVSLRQDGKVSCYDWKTGNIKEDSLQLKINACFLALKHPEIETFVTKYIWLKHDAVTPKDGVFSKADIPAMWEEILSWVERMKNAWKAERFDPKPSGLCRGWCEVTSCAHCGKGGRR